MPVSFFYILIFPCRQRYHLFGPMLIFQFSGTWFPIVARKSHSDSFNYRSTNQLPKCVLMVGPDHSRPPNWSYLSCAHSRMCTYYILSLTSNYKPEVKNRSPKWIPGAPMWFYYLAKSSWWLLHFYRISTFTLFTHGLAYHCYVPQRILISTYVRVGKAHSAQKPWAETFWTRRGSRHDCEWGHRERKFPVNGSLLSRIYTHVLEASVRSVWTPYYIYDLMGWKCRSLRVTMS